MTTPSQIKKLLAQHEILKLDIGCSAYKMPDFVGMDIRPERGVDIVHDWNVFPWPLPSNSVTLIKAGHVVEHVNPANFGFIKWMDECWRILKVGGQMMISTPFAGSTGYWSDPTHVNPCVPQTWFYFDPLATDPNGNPMNLYKEYRPKPFKIEQCFWSPDGNMEVLLSKRKLDPSYLL